MLWFDGMQQGVSQSLCELLASRSNMNMISLNRYSFIRGEVQFLRGRKVMFLPAKEAATGRQGGGRLPFGDRPWRLTCVRKATHGRTQTFVHLHLFGLPE